MRTVRITAICLCLATLALHGFAARGGLRVNESETRLSFEEGETRVALVVENDTGHQIRGHINLDLVDSYGDVRAQGQFDKLLPSGATTVVCRLALNFWTLTKDDQRRTLWYRLRYSAGSAEAFDEKPSVSGTISISEITPDFFDLSVVTPLISEQAARYHVRGRAAHPVSSLPISGVTVEAEITTDQSGLTHPKVSEVTNEQGYAVFDFDLPRCEKKCETRLKAVGSRAGLIQEVEHEIRFDRTIRIAVSTDKLIYQPEQTLHIRALALDPGRRAGAEKELTLKIEDPEDTILYRAVVKTSRFGIASADWPIPGNARLGDYLIRLHIDEEDEEAAYSPPIAVKISRYELPNFTVSAKSDRGFYLPGKNAEVEVRGDYLFGKPVSGGHVRVVRETSREWNYREQKWETEEEDKYEGELDNNGRFVARVDLRKEHAKLEEENYDRIRDLTYTAYLTDATTGRTEQRRFDLRVTKEPIHVYYIEASQGNTEGEPVEFYVSTCYASGEPAVCDVKISQDINQRYHPLRTVRTSRYGLAKVSGLRLAVNEPEPSLSFVARDRRSRVGHKTSGIDYWSSSAIRIETNKTLYRAGQPIEVTIASSQPRPSVFVDVARNWKLIRSQEVRLTRGKAKLALPYAGDFKDELTIAAYSHRDGLRRGFDVATRTVLYPRDRQLKLDVQMSRNEYRPGEEAVADLRVRTADGKAVESALGVSVTDRAVDERTRTDTEFSSSNRFDRSYRRMWEEVESLGGVTRASLDQLDRSKPVPSDLDLVAEVLLRRRGYWPQESGGDGYASNIKNLFYLVIEGQLKPVKAALASRYTHTGEYPRNPAMLRRQMSAFGISFDQMLDPWGLPYIAKFSIEQDKDVLEIESAGPDKRRGTADDFTVARLDWPYFKEKGQAIDRAVSEYHRRTLGYVRDSTTLKRELRLQGVIFDSLRDRWGKPYRLSLGVERTRYVVSVRSGGENKRFEPDSKGASDDFTLWTSPIDYSIDLRLRLNSALNDYFNATGRFPENETTALAVQALAAADKLGKAGAQVVTSHWEPWPANPKPAEPAQLQLRVSYDKTEAKVGDEVTSTVDAERVGFKGYGMMLAEIGLPPGADVDRASLDTAMRESDWSVQQYDVLPDRVVVYLWPRAGGVKFKFKTQAPIRARCADRVFGALRLLQPRSSRGSQARPLCREVRPNLSPRTRPITNQGTAPLVVS